MMMTATLLFMLTAAFMPTPPSGEKLYRANCRQCHGVDGTRGFFGAKDLQKSRLEDISIIQQINAGKGFMPSFRNKLTPGEITAIVSYVKQLRQ
jgi:mono/diheme cytochrome c family protein